MDDAGDIGRSFRALMAPRAVAADPSQGAPRRAAPDRQRIGRAAESIAAEFLQTRGLQVVTRNYRCRSGELDIVAVERNVLVIAEVRTRSTERYGGAAASVDRWKRGRIVRASQHLLQEHRELAGFPVRFDVLVVSQLDASTPDVEWLRHAFDAR